MKTIFIIMVILLSLGLAILVIAAILKGEKEKKAIKNFKRSRYISPKKIK